METDVLIARNKYSNYGREASQAQGPDASEFPEVFISTHSSHTYRDNEVNEARYSLPWDTA